MIHHFKCRVKTTDNWYPNFPEDEVELTLHIPDIEMIGKVQWCYHFRVSVWGNDDMGMKRDFFSQEDLHSALNLYHVLKKSGNITHQLCKELSLISA